MTNHVSIAAGAILSTAIIPGADGIAQIGATLIGTGLLTWISVMQGRELAKLRAENRTLTIELGKKCGNCVLAQKANSMLTDAGNEYMEHTEQK